MKIVGINRKRKVCNAGDGHRGNGRQNALEQIQKQAQEQIRYEGVLWIEIRSHRLPFNQIDTVGSRQLDLQCSLTRRKGFSLLIAYLTTVQHARNRLLC